MTLFVVTGVFLNPDDSVDTGFQSPGGIANPGIVKGHFGDLRFNLRLEGLI